MEHARDEVYDQSADELSNQLWAFEMVNGSAANLYRYADGDASHSLLGLCESSPPPDSFAQSM